MGKNDVTTTQQSGPTNPMVNTTLDKLLGQLGGSIDAGALQPFGKPLYPGVGPTTQQGWTSALTTARNPKFTTGLNLASDLSNGVLRNSGLTFAQKEALTNAGNTGGEFNRIATNSQKPGVMESNLMGTARGDMLDGANPFFEGNLLRAKDAAGAAVNAGIGAGGRFGSGAHVDKLASTIGNLETAARGQQYETERDRQIQALQGISGERQFGTNTQLSALTGRLGAEGQRFGMGQQAIDNIQNLGSNAANLFQSSLLPSATISAVGGQQDADKQAKLLAESQLFNTKQNNNLDWLAKLSSIFGGTAPFGGTTQTNTQPGTPWWQSLLGGGTALASAIL